MITTTSPSTTVPALSRLYAARFAFALVWAAVVVVSASELNPFVGVLLVLYPVYDIVGIAADARLSEQSRTRSTLYVNIAVSALAAIGLAVAATSGVPATLRVFGAWAAVAGIAQLVVALARRSSGGQLPVILSGAISVLAGANFIALASKDDPSLKALAEYALLGGLFYLASSILLRRRARRS
ncbi:MAG: hypothetical protein QOJ72_2766 [Nocardioidaceae bacterium]|jgi:uncharacterized membrane protein HdeD (DUF308 family)|nr:hypothetical protein [Nocardioidaceae bacterium]